MADDQQFSEDEHITHDRHDTVHADRPMGRRPGEHKDSIQRHQLVGPHESRNAENQVHLHKENDKKIFHGSKSGAGSAFPLERDRLWKT